MSKLLWLLQIVNLKIPGLIWRGKAYFVQNNTTIILPDHTRRTTSEVPCRTPAVHFDAKLTAWRHKICHIFHFLQSDMVFEIVSHFLCIFNSISSEKRGLISVPFDLLTWRQDTKIRAEKGRAVKRAVRSWANVWCGEGLARALLPRFRCN